MTDFSQQTRDVYHKQHTRIVNDKKAMKRFIGMFTTDYFGLQQDYFKGKKILDAGCGDTAKLIIALYKMGARDIHGLELGTDFIPMATKSLKNFKVPPKFVKFTSGNILNMPFEDEEFDFVACHGVLLHLNNMKEVDKAFSELARVTKRREGYLYTVFGSVGGLFEDAINPAIREHYRKNEEFKNFIDNISPKYFADALQLIKKTIFRKMGQRLSLKFFEGLFDEEYCVTIQNIIQAPVRLSIDENYILNLYSKRGFKKTKRLKRFVKRSNIRKFFAPLHYERDNRISKILYGSGNLEFISHR